MNIRCKSPGASANDTDAGSTSGGALVVANHISAWTVAGEDAQVSFGSCFGLLYGPTLVVMLLHAYGAGLPSIADVGKRSWKSFWAFQWCKGLTLLRRQATDLWELSHVIRTLARSITSMCQRRSGAWSCLLRFLCAHVTSLSGFTQWHCRESGVCRWCDACLPSRSSNALAVDTRLPPPTIKESGDGAEDAP